VSAFPEFSEIPAARNVEAITGGKRTYTGVRGELRYETRGTRVIHTLHLID
jgi:hypothetical protein